MSAFVLDASVAISWCFPGDPNEDTPFTRRVLKYLASNDAVSFRKRNRISEEQMREFLTLLRALPIRFERQSVWANVELESLARGRNLAAYDVAYLDLAQRAVLPLATSDAGLREAALALGIPLIS